MKRTLRTLAIMMLVVALLCTSAHAAGGSMSVSPASGQRGDTVNVTLKIVENPGVAYLGIGVDYDSSKLELVNLSGTGLSWTIGKIAVWADAVNSSYTGDIITATFKILDTAAIGDTTVSFDVVEAYNQDLDDVDFGEPSGTISITCVHTPNAGVVTKEANCTEDGVKTYTCTKCGTVTKTEPIKALGHNKDSGTVTKEATCTEDGVKTYKCTKCAAVLETQPIKALGHNKDNGTVTKEPTCTEDGVKTYKCTRCATVLETQPIKALGHNKDNGTVTKEPTCTEKGVKTYKCTRCSVVIGTEDIDALGHDFSNPVVTKEPTCTEDGVKTGTCKRCTKTTSEPIKALGHNKDNGTVTKEPTCTEKGVKTYKCTRCTVAMGTEEIDALGHDYNDFVVTKEPTCTEKGTQEKTCKRCPDKVTEDIDALGHDYSDFVVTKEPTCTEKGTQEKTCKRCPDKVTEDIDALGHDFASGYCKRCKEKDPNFKPKMTLVGKDGNVYQNKEAKFASDALKEDFEKVLVDGNELDAKQFAVKEGENKTTVVILSAKFTSDLSVGKHTLAIVSSTGTAETEFNVPSTIPTGDNSNIGFALVIAISSLLALAYTGIELKKRIINK